MKNLVPAALAALFVTACSSDTPLLSPRTLPDETRVVDGPSLAVPPDFTLRPPRQGETYEDQLRAQKTAEAQTLILGAPVSKTTATTSEDWLVGQAGTADPSIRESLTASATVPEQQPGFFGRLLGRDAN